MFYKKKALDATKQKEEKGKNLSLRKRKARVCRFTEDIHKN
jgi:hypothetical protein